MTMRVKNKNPEPGTDVRPERRVKLAHLKFDDQGRELMDPTQIAPPLGYKKSPSISDQIRQMIISEKLRQEAEEAGYETFDEADDFDVGDDFDPRSPYEEVFEPLPEVNEDDRLATLGTHIGRSIVSQLGGEQPLPAQPEAAPVGASLKPPGSGRREPPEAKPPNPSPAPGATSDAAGNLARGSLKPRGT